MNMFEGGIDVVVHRPGTICPYFKDMWRSNDPLPRYPCRHIYRTRFIWSEERVDIMPLGQYACSIKYYTMFSTMKIYRPWAVEVCV